MRTGLAALRILVVDDNAQMRSIIGTVLSGAGVGMVLHAPNARHALPEITGGAVDVVYLDCEMAEASGLDLLREIRALTNDARFIPVIMVTGHSDTLTACRARDAGVDEFLCKPVSARDLLGRLDSVLTHRRTFVNCPIYFGPDRRRTTGGGYRGPLRRSSDLDA